ncbi:zinc metalloprotease [Anaeromyxobacter paludicola]|uniref:Peptidase zinc-dependent n=1 Tax=Anaeromyxobacter paludicola TaxID=2918171 RepID=A0ABN6N904_9BACT|nr:peptidase M54 [Anaeromyxobacter paludicola]BDG09725.1 hypothetical protein AMPC_28380 [Anaeromyxobacter paludicola]
MLAQVGEAVRVAAACRPERAPAQDRPSYAFNKDRGQYNAAAVLRRLAALRGRRDGLPVLGITDADLFEPESPYVLGDADRSDQSAVVSLARLRGEQPVPPEQLRHRVAAEAVHQLGHLLGLLHCQDSRCAMYPSQRPSDADRKQPALCRPCRAAAGLEG